MTEWTFLIFLIISGMGVIICTIQLKDYRYPSQIHEENLKEFRKYGDDLMTTKRFNRVGGYVYDKDKCISHFEDVKHRDEIIDLSNALHDENEQLKQENEELKSEYKVLYSQYQDLKKFMENNFDEHLTQKELNRQIIKLSNENEQLKKETKKVFNLIDEKLDKYHKKQMECDRGVGWGDGQRYLAYQVALVNLKKELGE